MTSREAIEWVEERLKNCERNAAMQEGAEQAAWLEDAACFRAILTLLARDERTEWALFIEKWRWFLKDGETYHEAFTADVRRTVGDWQEVK